MKKIKIEKLLEWALLHELSKGGGEDGIASPRSAWALMEHVGTLGVHIDLTRGRQDLPMCFEQGDPHPDAVKVGEAIKNLKTYDFSCPEVTFEMLPLEDWTEEAKELARPDFENVLGRWHKCSAKDQAKSVIALVVSHAILKKQPECIFLKPKIEVIDTGSKQSGWYVKQKRIDSFGRAVEIEVDGFNRKTKRLLPGAYQKRKLVPSQKTKVAEWLDWYVWEKAVKFLFTDLVGTLSDFELIRA